MKINGATSTYLNPLLLIVWFFIWGICPNTTPRVQAAEALPVHPNHHEADDTHHASKGAEHSCSGSISYSKSDLGSDRLWSSAESSETAVFIVDPSSGLPHPPYFFELTFLPRLLTAYYQLYSVYRI